MNYNNYLNKESGKQDIYTKNSLLKMTLQDIIDKEMELSYQYNTIGIPADEDMYASPYVRQYTAESGIPMWTSATDVINNLQSLRQFASQPNFFPKGLKSTKEMIEEERQKRLLRQQQNSEMDLDTTQANDMMKPLEVNPDANALNMEPEEQINPFENWSTKSQPVQQTSNTNSLVGNIGNLANKLSQKFGNPMEEKLGLKVPEEESITPNTRVGIAQEMNVPIEDRGIVPQNKTPKKGGIAPLQEQKYTLRTDPMWDDMKREMLDPNIAAQKKLQEARELDAFNQAWDRIHGVKNVSKDGKVTGMATDLDKNVTKHVEKIKKLPQDLYNTAKNKFWKSFDKDFDKNKPMTLEEKTLKVGIEKLGNKFYPMASNATRNGMHDMEAARQAKNVKVYENLDSLEDSKTKEVLKKLGVKDTDKGAVYDIGSKESVQFGKSPELDAYLAKVREDVIAGKPLKDTSLYYDANGSDAKNNKEKFDRYATARRITVSNPKVDENGIFTCDLVDYSDFKNEPVTGIGTYLNKWGYKMQEKGKYKPHYQVIKIRRKVRW